MASNDEYVLVSSPHRTKPISNASHTHTSKSIETILKNNKGDYKIVNNPSKRLTTTCWTLFGFPAQAIDGGEFEIIQGFASCKQCFETFRYVCGSTTSLNQHQCPKSLPRGQQSIKDSVHSSAQRSAIIEKTIRKKKENVKRLCAQWPATSMRPFQIVADPGFKQISQECLSIGREMRSDQPVMVEEILCCDRTVRNEINRMADEGRKELKQKLIDVAQLGGLCLSPDIWTDNYRKVSYLGTTAHYIDEQYRFHSIDLFCTEFKAKRKTGDEILKVIEEQLKVFDLYDYIDLITFVTDRGANFIRGLRHRKVLHCVAHRLNNILKRTFYQQPKQNKKMSKVTPSKSACRVFIDTEITPSKETKRRTPSRQSSPEIGYPYVDNNNENDEDSDSSDDSSNDDEDDEFFLLDYSTTTLENLPQSAKLVIQTIKDCKALVAYVKKASLNREMQLQDEVISNNSTTTDESSLPNGKQSNMVTTLHQSSIVRCLSLSDLLESIKRSNEPLRVILTQRNEQHRIEKINMSIVQQLIEFFQPWKYILKEIQKGNSPSLFAVLPCVTFLKEDLINREKKEKYGMKFFAKRAQQLLNSMFQVDDIHVIGAFLHPNYKTLRFATSTQIDCCHQRCRNAAIPEGIDNAQDEEAPVCEPKQKRQKVFMKSLMDHNVEAKRKKVKQGKDEVDRYIEFDLQGKVYLDPLHFWKENESNFPCLSRLAKRYLSIPCNSAAVEREFSAAGQIISQRRSTIEPSTVDNILFLRSIANNKIKTTTT
ncbi:unnamed protein product [Adineta ricciae]|uniref:HAT C-terminal dimerisation domain-containing protein n=1 Tax=Adineta ricciae TaxID=249248 RepID=A0A815UW81_ADIRI|nr:unnamed protein product [Adineta ricciae]